MKKLFYWWVAVCCWQTTSAQNLVKVQPGTAFTITGNTAITLQDLSLHNDGFIDPGEGSFIFTGTADNTIAGSFNTQFNLLQMAKTGTGRLSLQQHIGIRSGILFNTGNIDLNGYNIFLEPTALLNNESNGSRIVGSTGGYVQISTRLDAPTNANPGNLGLAVSTTQNLGFTTFRRGHGSQKDAYNQGSSILRYYDIIPENNSGLNATLNFYYLDAELNGMSEPLLTLWTSNDNRIWKNLGFSSINTTSNVLQHSGINHFARFTLSTFNNPLPLTFLGFNIRCDNNTVNLQWKTAQEVNTSHFVVERSSDGLTYHPIGKVAAAGHSPGERNYQYKDLSPLYGQGFYRVVAHDLDGSKHYTGINSSSCNTTEGFKLAPNPAQDKTWVTINTLVPSAVYISLYNNNGQLVHTVRGNLLAGSNQLPLNLGALPAGNYHGVATWQNGARRQSFSFVKGVN